MPEKEYKNMILDWMEERIKVSHGFFLPLRKLIKELHESLKTPIPPLPEIRKWLEEDGRFDILEVPDNPGDSPVEQEQMEQLGFFRGPRVGLKDRRPSPEQVVEKLKEHSENLIQSLQKAYASRPREGSDSDGVEDQLIELLRRAKKLKEEIPKISIRDSAKPEDSKK